MCKIFKTPILLLLLTGCSIKIPTGTYTTAAPPSSGRFSLAGHDLTLTDNGRFQYAQWSDDAPTTRGHGGYAIVGNNLFLLFENSANPSDGYTMKEFPCTKQDSQVVNFKFVQASGKPLIGVTTYNKNDPSQGTLSQMNGIGQISMPKTQDKKVFVTNYIGYKGMEIEFDGDQCYDIDISIHEKSKKLQLGHAKVIKLKKAGDQLSIKMPIWKNYKEVYLRE